MTQHLPIRDCVRDPRSALADLELRPDLPPMGATDLYLAHMIFRATGRWPSVEEIRALREFIEARRAEKGELAKKPAPRHRREPEPKPRRPRDYGHELMMHILTHPLTQAMLVLLSLALSRGQTMVLMLPAPPLPGPDPVLGRTFRI